MEYKRSILLQSILFFIVAKICGETRSTAVSRFIKTELFRRLGDITVGTLFDIVDIAYTE